MCVCVYVCACACVCVCCVCVCVCACVCRRALSFAVYVCFLLLFFSFFFLLGDQGDVKFAEVLERMGATLTWESNAMTVARDMATPLKGVDVDCGEIPDAAMTLAVSLAHVVQIDQIDQMDDDLNLI